MDSYLEEAAALLRKAAEENEAWHRRGFGSTAALIAGRERVAMKFAQLAAINCGVMPVELAELILAQARAEATR